MRIFCEVGFSGEAKKEHIKLLFLFFGLAFVILFYLPTFLLGENSGVSIHDQLDGEIFTYIMRARHPFSGFYPEFMDGASSEALTMASTGSLLFFLIFPPFWAYELNSLFVSVVAYVSMFLCINKLLKRPIIAMVTSILYSSLPFYSVYGLSSMGQPLILYAVLLAKERKVLPYILIAFFACFSSPVLVGFADCAILFFICLVFLFKKNNPMAKAVFLLAVELVLIYAILYYKVILGVLSPSIVPHRVEFILHPQSWKSNVKTLLINGHYHAPSLHRHFLYWAFIGLLVSVALAKDFDENIRKISRIWGVSLFCICLIALFYGFFHSSVGIVLRNHLKGLSSFQADRIYWLYPVLWYLVFACILFLITQPLHSFSPVTENKTRAYQKYAPLIARSILCCMLLVPSFQTIYQNSILADNVKAICTGNQDRTTWAQFFGEDLFDNIRDFIGRPQAEYRVVSVGLYPSIPLYNGFYCLDGYSNNYPLDYKHSFRKIIAPELEKNETIRTYYDEWGNRCYVFSSELGQQYFLPKGAVISNLTLSHEALQDMGCDYVLSAAVIQNSADSGLTFMKEFQVDNIPYSVYLYHINE